MRSTDPHGRCGRSRLAVIAAVLAVAWTGSVVTPAPSAGATSTGDLTFWLDAAGFLGPDGHTIEELSLRIPNDELRWIRRDGAWTSRIRVTWRIERPGGVVEIEQARTTTLRVPDEESTRRPVLARSVTRRFVLEPGAYDVSVAVENLDAPRHTLVGMVKKRVATATVRRLRVLVPEFPPRRISLSDPRYVWNVRRDTSGTVYVPNPSRVYGLYRDTLRVYLELYVPDSLAGAPSFTVGSEILDDTLGVVSRRRIALANPGTRWGAGGLRAWPLLVREDLSRVPAGRYALAVTFTDGHGGTQRVACGTFSVAWDLHTWETRRRDYLAEARFLLEDVDFEEFAKLEPGEQERRLAEMWRREDPDPDTAVNEAYDEYLSRLAWVRTHYVEDAREAFSPRAEIYLRFGPPDDVVQDVIPVNRDALSEALALVGDRYHALNATTHGVKITSGRRQTGHIIDPRNLSGQREGDNVSYPFELWIYTDRGHPILRRDRAHTMDIGMRFLFIDREGYGRYRLESSSAITDK